MVFDGCEWLIVVDNDGWCTLILVIFNNGQSRAILVNDHRLPDCYTVLGDSWGTLLLGWAQFVPHANHQRQNTTSKTEGPGTCLTAPSFFPESAFERSVFHINVCAEKWPAKSSEICETMCIPIRSYVYSFCDRVAEIFSDSYWVYYWVLQFQSMSASPPSGTILELFTQTFLP